MKKRNIDNTKILEMRQQGKTFSEIGKIYGITKVAVYKRFKKLTKVKIQAQDENPKELGQDKRTLPKPRYLRKQGTNMIFAYSDVLMKRGDMVVYEGPIPMPAETIPEHERPKVNEVNKD